MIAVTCGIIFHTGSLVLDSVVSGYGDELPWNKQRQDQDQKPSNDVACSPSPLKLVSFLFHRPLSSSNVEK